MSEMQEIQSSQAANTHSQNTIKNEWTQNEQDSCALLSYLVLAEFDIDKGSLIRHQYPSPCPMNSSSLADSMLPEGGHLRDEDWTLFFIRPESDAVELETESPIHNISSDSRMATRTLELQQRCEAEAAQFNVSAQCFVLETTSMQWGPLSPEQTPASLMFEVCCAATASRPPQYALCVSVSEMRNSSSNMSGSEPDNSSALQTNTNIHRRIVLNGSIEYAFRDSDLFASIEHGENISERSRDSLSFTFSTHEDLLSFENMIYKLLDSTKGHVHGLQDASDLADPDIDAQYIAFEKKQMDVLTCLNLVRTRKDSAVRRGAIVKALAVVTPYRYVHALRGLLSRTLDAIFNVSAPQDREISESDDTVLAIMIEVYNAVNGLAKNLLPPIVSNCERNVLLSSFNDPSNLTEGDHHQTVYNSMSKKSTVGENDNECESEIPLINITVNLSDGAFQLHLPLCTEIDDVGGVQTNILLQKFGEETMTIFNSILSGRRVLFSGHNLAAWTVCEYVLAAVQLIAPVRGIMCARAFPYAHLTDLGFLKVPGFIVGVTNPIFEQHENWWDVLCNCVSGEITTKERFETPRRASFSVPSRNDVSLNSVSGHRSGESLDQEVFWTAAAGVQSVSYVKSVFRHYTTSIVDQAFSFEHFADDAHRRAHFNANAKRLSEWRETESFIDTDLAHRYRRRQSRFGQLLPAIWKNVRSLQQQRLPDAKFERCIIDIATRVRTHDQTLELVDMMPSWRGGLSMFAIGLLHSRATTRAATLSVLQRIDETRVARKAIDNLNFTLLLSYRQCRRMHEGNEESDSDDDRAQQVMLPEAKHIRAIQDMPDSLNDRLTTLTTTSLAHHSPTSLLVPQSNLNFETLDNAHKNTASSPSTKNSQLNLQNNEEEENCYGSIATTECVVDVQPCNDDYLAPMTRSLPDEDGSEIDDIESCSMVSFMSSGSGTDTEIADFQDCHNDQPVVTMKDSVLSLNRNERTISQRFSNTDIDHNKQKDDENNNDTIPHSTRTISSSSSSSSDDGDQFDESEPFWATQP